MLGHAREHPEPVTPARRRLAADTPSSGQGRASARASPARLLGHAREQPGGHPLSDFRNGIDR